MQLNKEFYWPGKAFSWVKFKEKTMLESCLLESSVGRVFAWHAQDPVSQFFAWLSKDCAVACYVLNSFYYSVSN